MPLQTSMTLQTIRCIRQSESSGSEPYVWPFLATMATGPGSFDTFPSAAILADSRKVIASSMKAGASAPLLFPGNVVSHTFADGQSECTALLVVALMEADDNRVVSMQAGYQAFLDELRAQMGHKMLALKSATDAERALLIADIKKAVEKKTKDAVANTISTWEKTKIVVGAMDTDDFLAVDFRLFEKVETSPPSAPFTLRFATGGNEFEIGGVTSVTTVQVNPCQPQVDGVAAAQQAIRALQGQIQTLQAMLQTATPQQKPGIIKSIDRIRTEQIPAAEEALQRAERALRHCEVLGGSIVIDQPGVTPIVP